MDGHSQRSIQQALVSLEKQTEADIRAEIRAEAFKPSLEVSPPTK